MKNKIILLFALVFVSRFCVAQYEPAYGNEKKNKDEASDKPNRKVFLGIGSGLQYKYGLIGLGFGYRVAPSAIVEMNFGIGGYGTKVGLTGVFNTQSKNKWCPAISFSNCSGVQSLAVETEVLYNGTTTKSKSPIFLDPIFTLICGFQRQFVGKNGNRFVLELGYAIPLNKQVYGFAEQTVKVDNSISEVLASDVSFSDTQKKVFKIQSPAGIMFGLSYNIGFK